MFLGMKRMPPYKDAAHRCAGSGAAEERARWHVVHRGNAEMIFPDAAEQSRWRVDSRSRPPVSTALAISNGLPLKPYKYSSY